MKSLAIVALCIGSAVVYGIVHDQITARICVEYFTIGHPPVFDTKSPTLLAIGWGIIATWWVGLLLGVPLAIVARAGRRPKRDARSLVRPIITLLVVMAVCALISGTIGYVLARGGSVYLVEPLSERVPLEKQAAFLADLWAHSMSYLVGFVGGLVVIGSVWRSRGRTATNPQIPK